MHASQFFFQLQNSNPHVCNYRKREASYRELQQRNDRRANLSGMAGSMDMEKAVMVRLALRPSAVYLQNCGIIVTWSNMSCSGQRKEAQATGSWDQGQQQGCLSMEAGSTEMNTSSYISDRQAPFSNCFIVECYVVCGVISHCLVLLAMDSWACLQCVLDISAQQPLFIDPTV